MNLSSQDAYGPCTQVYIIYIFEYQFTIVLDYNAILACIYMQAELWPIKNGDRKWAGNVTNKKMALSR